MPPHIFVDILGIFFQTKKLCDKSFKIKTLSHSNPHNFGDLSGIFFQTKKLCDKSFKIKNLSQPNCHKLSKVSNDIKQLEFWTDLGVLKAPTKNIFFLKKLLISLILGDVS